MERLKHSLEDIKEVTFHDGTTWYEIDFGGSIGLHKVRLLDYYTLRLLERFQLLASLNLL